MMRDAPSGAAICAGNCEWQPGRHGRLQAAGRPPARCSVGECVAAEGGITS